MTTVPPGHRAPSPAQLASRWLLGPLFVAAGVMHFVKPDFYVQMMPPYLPWHRELVFLSGVCEVVGGVALLVPRLRVAAAWGLIALLVAVFPANVHMALNPELFPSIPPAALWVRLPLQAALIAWVYWFTKRERSRVEETHAG
jgi:uncharacterized membrane protein